MRKITGKQNCEYSSCDKKATDMVYSRTLQKVLVCCEKHAEIVQDEHSPEYFHTCENCNCRLPIN